jgi:integrase
MEAGLTGRVRAVTENRRVVRGRFQLVVNLPPVPVLDQQGQAVTDACGEPCRRYPEKTRLVEASGVKAAERLLQKWMAELEAHRCIDPETLTMAGLFALWLEDIKSPVVRAATWDTYERNARLHLLPTLGERIANDLRPGELARLYADGMEDHAETTVHHWHSAVKAAYSWGQNESFVSVNPAKRVKKPPRLVTSPRAVLTIEEVVEATLACQKTQLRAACPLAGLAGLRVGEICALRLADIDLELGIVHVNHTVEEEGTKAARRLLEYPPKGGTAEGVPMPGLLRDILRQVKREQDKYRLARRGWNPEGWIVPKLDGTQMWPSTLKSQWARWFARYRRRATNNAAGRLGRELKAHELLPHVSLHGLRDSYGTDLFKCEGVKIAQERLRHKQASTTLNHYVHLTEADEVAAISRLEQDVQAARQRALVSLAGDSRIIPENVVSLLGRSGRK